MNRLKNQRKELIFLQEEVEMRTVTMAFHASKFSGRVMKNGIAKLLHAMHGKIRA